MQIIIIYPKKLYILIFQDTLYPIGNNKKKDLINFDNPNSICTLHKGGLLKFANTEKQYVILLFLI